MSNIALVFGHLAIEAVDILLLLDSLGYLVTHLVNVVFLLFGIGRRFSLEDVSDG